MSQRSAPIAAAIATAEVSEPPRPSVVMRPVSWCRPWKPEITATCLCSLKRLISSAPLTSRMRAEPCALSVRIGNCQPCHERALTPMPSSTIASSPAVTCSPDATTASYSRASCSGAACRHQSTSSLVAPAMADTTTATSWPASTSRLTWRATLRMRSMSATEVPPNFITRRAMAGYFWSQARMRAGAELYGKPPRQKARIHTGEVSRPQPKCLVWRRSMAAKAQRAGLTVDADEVARFSALAATWWDPRGKMGMLHKFNPVRLGYIKQAACRQFERDAKRLDSLAGLRILDIGCGGGILSEPLARLGAAVVGADPAEANIAAARLHAAEAGVSVDYRATTAEALADAGERFDVVLAMEVVEHVADVSLFIKRCAEMLKPGGLMIAATLNRTLKSFPLAIVGAEYVLRWLPRGTHRWEKFVTPAELEYAIGQAGMRVVGETGVIYNPLSDQWRLSSDMDVNYMLTAEKALTD